MNYFSAKSKSPELQYPSLKLEDVGGNEETLTVSDFNLCYLMDVPIFSPLVKQGWLLCIAVSLSVRYCSFNLLLFDIVAGSV